MPAKEKLIISKERHALLSAKLESIVEQLQELNDEERIRVLRTISVFFGLERQVDFE